MTGKKGHDSSGAMLMKYSDEDGTVTDPNKVSQTIQKKQVCAFEVSGLIR